MGYWQNELEIEKRYVAISNAGLIRSHKSTNRQDGCVSQTPEHK